MAPDQMPVRVKPALSAGSNHRLHGIGAIRTHGARGLAVDRVSPYETRIQFNAGKKSMVVSRSRGTWGGFLNAAVALPMSACVFLAQPAISAPLPPLAPVDVCGDIKSVKWLPSRTAPPDEGKSGSAGRQRNWPERFVVVLSNVTGISEPTRIQINRLLTTSADGAGTELGATELLLVLPSDDRTLLARALNICVTGFVVRGDEGGTWTRYEDLSISGNN